MTKGASETCARERGASTSSDSRVASSPKVTTLREGELRTEPVHDLAAVDDDREPMGRGRHDLLAQQAPPSPLIRLSVPRRPRQRRRS